MVRRPPRSTLTDTLFPYTTRFRSPITAWVCGLSNLPNLKALTFGRSTPLRWTTTQRHGQAGFPARSEEHTSELQLLMRLSYAVFCLKKNTHNIDTNDSHNNCISSII